MSRRFPIGFHTGVGGNAAGLKDNFMAPLDAAGIQFFIKSTDAYPQDAVDIALASGVKHTIVWRSTNTDLPDYSLDPGAAAQQHYNAVMSYLPSEFNKDIVWLEPVNEVDKNQADWLGWFAVAWANLAEANGFKICMFGWSGGEPEPEHWQEPGMQAFLRLAASRPDRLAVSLHEYSFEVNNIERWWDWLVGRYRRLFEACDSLGIARVTVLITEWGWTLNDVPDVSKALADIDLIAQDYVVHPQILGAGLWYLGGGFGGIADEAQRLIAPVGQLALGWGHYVEVPDTPSPPIGECIDTEAYTRYHILRPSTLTADQWNYIKGLMTDGVDISGVGHVTVGYEGWSHLDAMGAIKEAVLAGFSDSRLIVVDGHEIGTGLDERWMEENCPMLVDYTVFLRSDGTSGPFSFQVWPTNYREVNQFFANNPGYYSQFGLPGHDGVDIRAPEGSPIYSVASGIVYRVHTSPGTHNYGIHVRVLHQDGWKTIYAHLSSVGDGIALNQVIGAGRIVGYSGNTGNSFGAHLHLGLKKDNSTYVDSSGTPWPYNLYDPTQYLRQLCPACFEPALPPQAVKLGLHASADPGLASGEADMFAEADIELVKILSNLPASDVTALASACPNAPFVIRAFLDFGGRNVSPQQFYDWTISDVRRSVERLAGRDIIVELHNEPNLVQEGLTTSWQDGASFATWLQEVTGLYRSALPQVKLAYPGLSPGEDVPGIRMNSTRFINESAHAADGLDYVGAHAYWAANWPMQLALDTVDGYLAAFPGKTIIVTEASNNRRDTTPENKAAEYVEFANRLGDRSRVYGVTYFVASASNQAWGWVTGSGEVWLGTTIPAIVGSR